MDLAKCNLRKIGPDDWQLWVPKPEYDEAGSEVGRRGTTYHRSHSEALAFAALAAKDPEGPGVDPWAAP